jgi:hypothetical protein
LSSASPDCQANEWESVPEYQQDGLRHAAHESCCVRPPFLPHFPLIPHPRRPSAHTHSLHLRPALPLLLSHPSTLGAVSFNSCCGLQWLQTATTFTATPTVTCAGAPYNQSATTACNCKHIAQAANSSACESLVNYTWIAGACQPYSCPPGYRVYQTGAPPILCVDNNYHDLFNLFETSCQGSPSFFIEPNRLVYATTVYVSHKHLHSPCA